MGSLVVEGASLAHWTEAHLHRLVAHFLQVSGAPGRGGWRGCQVMGEGWARRGGVEVHAGVDEGGWRRMGGLGAGRMGGPING